MSEMLELAERCERLEGPDREADLEICLLLSPDSDLANRIANSRRGLDGKPGASWDISSGAVLYEVRNEIGVCWANGGIPVPRYTASLDAAMTLVGPMQLSKVGELWDGTIKCGWATVHNYSNTERGMMWDDQHDVCAKTPALALCAAALLARNALNGEKND